MSVTPNTSHHPYQPLTRTYGRQLASQRDMRKAAHAIIVGKEEEDGRCYLFANLRFDGFIGFPGGFVDHGESVRVGLNRELREEINLQFDMFEPKDNSDILYEMKEIDGIKTLLVTCMKMLSADRLKHIEDGVFAGPDLGLETLGVLRFPLDRLEHINEHNGLKLIGNALDQGKHVASEYCGLANLIGDIVDSQEPENSLPCFQVHVNVWCLTKRKLFDAYRINGYTLTILTSKLEFSLPCFRGHSCEDAVEKSNIFLSRIGVKKISSTEIKTLEEQWMVIINRQPTSEEVFLRYICPRTMYWCLEKGHIGMAIPSVADIPYRKDIGTAPSFLHTQPCTKELRMCIEHLIAKTH